MSGTPASDAAKDFGGGHNNGRNKLNIFFLLIARETYYNHTYKLK